MYDVSPQLDICMFCFTMIRGWIEGSGDRVKSFRPEKVRDFRVQNGGEAVDRSRAFLFQFTQPCWGDATKSWKLALATSCKGICRSNYNLFHHPYTPTISS